MIDVKFVNGKYVAVINGKTVKRAKKEHMDYVIRKAQSNESVMIQTDAPKCEFSVMERFGFIHKFVTLLSRGTINSFVLTGSGGIGKTTAVMETLSKLGYREDTPDQPAGDFIVIRGFSTPRALYETLFQFKDKVIVMDDADQVFRDPLGANLLKAALDDKKVRIVNWNTSREDSDIPSRFTYTGKIVFVSNLSISQFPQAIVSRSQKVDLTLNIEEKVEIIGEVFKKIKHNDKQKADVLEFVKENATKAKDLNIRSAVALLVLRENFGDDWKRIAEYSFSN
jgi:Cdc6-like AAA superfamily ATPase